MDISFGNINTMDTYMNLDQIHDDVSLGAMCAASTYINSTAVYQNDNCSGSYDTIPYEDTANRIDQNASYAQPSLPSSEETFKKDINDSFRNNAYETQDETEVKTTFQSQEPITKESKRANYKNEQSHYQSLLTLKEEKIVNLPTGVTTLEEFCAPFHNHYKAEEVIVDDINGGQTALETDLIKHVHAVRIPSAVSQIDLRALAKLSDCYNDSIQTRISREIQNILFKTEVGRHNLGHLLESVHILLGVVRRRAGSSDTLLNTLPNVIVMLALSHHLLLSHCNKTSVSDTVMPRLEGCLVLLEEIEYPQTKETEIHLLNALKMMICGLKKVMTGKKGHRLQIGSWKDELQKESCRAKISKSLPKMSLHEHYSLIVRLIVELHLRLIDKHMEFLHASLMSIKSAMKKTDGPILYPLLVVVFRGIASLLNHPTQQSHHREEVQESIYKTCIDILRKCLESAKICPECKQDLRQNLNTLAFPNSKYIASSVATLLATDGRYCVAEMVYSRIKTMLEPLSFSISSESQERQGLPRWEEVSGTITGHKEVSVYVLLPTKGTYDLREYHQSVAKDIKSGMHSNTLEILRGVLGSRHHPNIKRLIAFSLETIPMFYMTEKLSDISLSTFLLRERKRRTWLPVLTLGSFALDCVRAVDFLRERKIVHRNLTASSFHCRRDQDHVTFVLSDFSIAKSIDDGSSDSGVFVQDMEGNLIPTRWSAPESLIDDRYDDKSDIWMLGQLLTEIFTHGCHPFPEMVTFAFDDLMDMVIFHELKPNRWPCIPLPVHNIILQCVETKPHSRIKPKEVLEKLNDWKTYPGETDGQIPSITAIANKILKYPELDPNQKEPERGSTEQLKQLKNMRGNPRVSYYNKASKRRLSSFVQKCCIKQQNLTAPDQPIIKEKGLYLEIEEPVTSAFMRETFPKLCNKAALGDLLHIVTFPPERHKRECTNPDGLTDALSYRCKRADSLSNIAEQCSLGDPEDNEMPYLEVVYELVQFVNEMHKHCWILRDLCCSTLYRSQAHNKVFMPRVGRMLKLEKRNSLNEACIVDKSTCVDDRRNWMPAEVIQSGQFSQASDVYMLAMTIYQFYFTASLFKSKPTASRLEAVPFCKVEPNQLLETLYRGEVPEEPDSCPAWLFELLKKCWNRDSTKRPSTDFILEEIHKRLIYTDDKTFESMSSQNSSQSADSVVSRESQGFETPSKVPNIPTMAVTDPPVPPPRPKRAMSKSTSTQRNEYYNVNAFMMNPPALPPRPKSTKKRLSSIQENEYLNVEKTVQGYTFPDKSPYVARNEFTTSLSANLGDSNVSCPNNSDSSFEDTVNGSYHAEKKSTRKQVASSESRSNPILPDKGITRYLEGDIPGYLEIDGSNEETCVKAKQNCSEFDDLTYVETVQRTAFLDDSICYQDFDPPNEEEQKTSTVRNAFDLPNVCNSIQNRPMQALPQTKDDVSRSASIVSSGSSNDSAISCANSETHESFTNVYDYATSISNPSMCSLHTRPPQTPPKVSGNHGLSITSSIVSNGSSADSDISCANSEKSEPVRDVHDYANFIQNSPTGSLRDRPEQTLPKTFSTPGVSRTPSILSNGSLHDPTISCVNSETLEPGTYVYDYADTIPNSSDTYQLTSNNHVVSRSGSIVSKGSSNDSAISCANSETHEPTTHVYDYADILPDPSDTNKLTLNDHVVCRSASIVSKGSSNDSAVSCANSEAAEAGYESVT